MRDQLLIFAKDAVKSREMHGLLHYSMEPFGFLMYKTAGRLAPAAI